MDYPTITQVVDAVEESSITPVFAIGRSYENMYQVIWCAITETIKIKINIYEF